MNREIKFRAWDIEDNRMYHDVMVGRGGNYIAYKYTTEADKDEDGEDCDFEVTYSCFDNSKHNNTVIMQCVGLKDKNGKEIYEGDILQSHYTGKTYPVVFRNGAFVSEDKSTSLGWYLWGKCEIIGNIHTDKHLLK